MDAIIYRKAAENIAGEPVSIEPDGSVWVDSNHRVIDRESIEAEIIRLEQELVDVEAAKVAARESAMAKLAALGLNVSEVEAIVGSV